MVNATDFSKLKVTELKKKLTELGLDTTGLKAVLVKRLEDYHDQLLNNDNSGSEDIKEPEEPEEENNFIAENDGQEVEPSREIDHHEMKTSRKNEEDNAPENINPSEDNNDSVNEASTNSKRRKRKKKKRAQRPAESFKYNTQTENEADDENIEIEYVPELPQLDESDPFYEQFVNVFKHFDPAQMEDDEEDGENYFYEDNLNQADGAEGYDEEGKSISKKLARKLSRMTVAELKQKVIKPDVVEWVDVTSPDPLLLVELKSCRNSVPVPGHWSQKRKFLQNKRGMEKPPFELPAFIKSTGIMEVRQAVKDKESVQKLKAKMREKLRPKMGKIDVDYQKLHDAFFKYQTKPEMTIHGDLYYEGKEFEVKYKTKRPGNLSEELKAALGVPPGGPPPWLINMQRFGPPPSYPFMKIPGLNAPIPVGAQWGFHPGGWGKPPVDEFNRPLYGDVFGLVTPAQPAYIAPVEKSHWGDLLIEAEEYEEEEEEGDEVGEDDMDMDGNEEEGNEEQEEIVQISTFEQNGGMATPSGTTSIPLGLQTPDEIQLKKDRKGAAVDFSNESRPLYTILQQKEKRFKQDVSVALNPEELEDSNAIRQKYEAEMQQAATSIQKEDLSDLVADHAAQRKGSNYQSASSSGGSASLANGTSSAANNKKTSGGASSSTKKFKF